MVGVLLILFILCSSLACWSNVTNPEDFTEFPEETSLCRVLETIFLILALIMVLLMMALS